MYILDEPKKEEPKKKTEELDEETSEDKENTMYPWKNLHLSIASINLLILCLLVSSADKLCKQFVVFLEEFFEKVDFEKNQQTKNTQYKFIKLFAFQ